MEAIGLYGGTFAPPHLGHVHAAKAFLRQVPIDRLIIMPTGTPPHKEKASGDTPEVRLAMCRAAFGDLPKTTVSDYEIAKGNVSYTVETLRYLAEPDRTIYLLCGTDMFLTLDRWYQAADIFRLAEIVCIARTDAQNEAIHQTAARYRETYGKASILLTAAPLELSSTEIREAIQTGKSLEKYVPKEVEAIIRNEKLYL